MRVASLNAGSLECPDVAVYGVRGSGEDYASSEFGMGPTVSSVADTLLHLLPATLRVLRVGVPYPAVGPAYGLLNGDGNGPYNGSVLSGAELLVNGRAGFEGIGHLVVRCPNVSLVLIGLSQGAQVVTEALFQAAAPTRVTKRISAIVLFGNPVRQANMAYDVGTNAHSGVFSSPGLQPGKIGVSLPSFLWADARSYCLLHDPICAFSPQDFKDNLAVHSTYAVSPYAAAGAAFAAAKILALLPSPPIVTVRPIKIAAATANATSSGWISWTIETAKPFSTDDAPCLQLRSVQQPALSWLVCGNAASGFAVSTRPPLQVGGGYAGKADIRRPDPTTIVYRIPRSIFTGTVPKPTTISWQAQIIDATQCSGVCDELPAGPHIVQP